jgi:septum site-determining protein MinC
MPRTKSALELKGRMLAVTRVRVIDADPAAIKAQLADFATQMPQAVKGMAAVIDSEVPANLPELLGALRGVGMQPIAVSEGPLAGAARAVGIAVVSKDTGKASPKKAPVDDEPTEPELPLAVPEPLSAVAEPAPVTAQPDEPAAAPATVAVRKPTRVVTEPVRSGQQVYAEGADLIVLNTVSPGAEVIADGCIHVYGKLAGRAIAGARGDESARIFCRKMDAELIVIAGIYAVADQIRSGPKNEPTQAYLDGGKLKIEPHKV